MPNKKYRQANFLGFIFQSKVAILIIAVNVLIFWFINHWLKDIKLLMPYILYPANLFRGNYWCLITAGFIHKNWQHLALNMLGVFVFGRIVERRLGFLKTLFIYLGALVLSMFFSVLIYTFLLHKNVAIIGASGAVMGLMATAMLLEPFCITFELLLPIPLMIKGWMFFYADLKGFLGGESDGISHLAHLLGFLSVGILMYFLSRQDKRRLRTGLVVNIISFTIFILFRFWWIRS